MNPFGNIGNIMKQAKEMQEKLKQAQAQLAEVQVEGEAGAGMVKITMNGSGEAVSLQIDDAVYKEDKKILQGLIVAAINDASHKRDLKKKELMSGFMSGMNLPADLDLFQGG